MKVNTFYNLYNYNHYFPKYKMHLCVRHTMIIKTTFTVRNYVLYTSIMSTLDTITISVIRVTSERNA